MKVPDFQKRGDASAGLMPCVSTPRGRSNARDKCFRLKHQFRHYDLPFIAAKAVLVFRLRLLSAPCDDSEDRGEPAAYAIRDLKTGGKLSYHRPLAIQEFPTIRPGSYLQMVAW